MLYKHLLFQWLIRHTVDGRNPASPWMVETLNGIDHLSTGAGFRNHPQYDLRDWHDFKTS